MAAAFCHAALLVGSRNPPELQEGAQGWPAAQAWLRPPSEASVLLPGGRHPAQLAVPKSAANNTPSVAAESLVVQGQAT